MSKFKKVLGLLSNPKYLLYRISQKYIKNYEGFSYNFENNGELRLIKKLKNQDINVIFDVGANVGDWTSMAIENFPRSRLHSFELSNRTFKNLKQRNFDERVRLNNIGLSDSVGETLYKDYGENSGFNTILPNADFHDEKIPPIICLGNFL